jgi:molybdate transport system ATP-binding protein
VVTVAGEISAVPLSLRVLIERRAANSPSFVLDVSLEIPSGITILFGPSGAGKSTLLDCIAGLLRPDAGHIKIGDESLFDSEARVNVPTQRRRMAYVFQSLALFPHMTVEENVAYGLADLTADQRTQRIAEILQAFRVENLAKRRAGEISGGEKQRVALARSLVTLPRVLLLDEPLSGLDAELKASILDDLRAWNAAQRIPILYVTHTRDEVDALGERVVVLDRGRVIDEGRPHEVLDAPRRTRLAQAAGFENLLDATVVELREADGVMRVRLAGGVSEIEVPLGYAAPNDRVKIAIRAGDILLATQPPVGLSARNILEGNIVSLERRGTLVVAHVEAGVIFTIHVTPGAARALELIAGRHVWVVLKSRKCISGGRSFSSDI